jgi:hypothetical protein
VIDAVLIINGNYGNEDIVVECRLDKFTLGEDATVRVDMSPYRQKQLFDKLRGIGKETNGRS